MKCKLHSSLRIIPAYHCISSCNVHIDSIEMILVLLLFINKNFLLCYLHGNGNLFPDDECHALLHTIYGVSCKIHSPL